jgi:hypothetical protein
MVAEGGEKIDFPQTSDLDGAPEAADNFSLSRSSVLLRTYFAGISRAS